MLKTSSPAAPPGSTPQSGRCNLWRWHERSRGNVVQACMLIVFSEGMTRVGAMNLRLLTVPHLSDYVSSGWVWIFTGSQGCRLRNLCMSVRRTSSWITLTTAEWHRGSARHVCSPDDEGARRACCARLSQQRPSIAVRTFVDYINNEAETEAASSSSLPTTKRSAASDWPPSCGRSHWTTDTLGCR